MKNKWYSVLCFLFLSGLVFLLMYFVQNYNKEFDMKELEVQVEKEIIELHSK
jgi:hypothetical protein